MSTPAAPQPPKPPQSQPAPGPIKFEAVTEEPGDFASTIAGLATGTKPPASAEPPTPPAPGGEPPKPGEGEPPKPGEGEPPKPGEGEPPKPGEGEPPKAPFTELMANLGGDKKPGEGEPPKPGEGEPPKPAEVTDDELPDDIKNATPATQSSWKLVKGELKTVTAERDQLRQQLEEAKKNPVVDPQLQKRLEDTEAKAAELEGYVKLHKVEMSTEYREAVSTPLANIKERAKALATKYEVDPNELFRVISDPKAAREVLSSFDERDKHDVFRLQDEYESVWQLRESIKANAGEALQRLEEAQKKDGEAKVEAFRNSYQTGLKNSRENGAKEFGFLAPIEGNEEWNQTIESMNTFLDSVNIEQLAPNQIAELVFRAGAIIPTLKLARGLAAENKAMAERIAALTKARPGAGGGNEPPPPPSLPEIPEDADFAETVAAKFKAPRS